MCVFEYNEKRSRLLIQIMTAIEDRDAIAECRLRKEMTALDSLFKNSQRVTVNC